MTANDSITKGKIFLTPFPFDDLSISKLRPALCLTNPIGSRRHVILAYITTGVPTFLVDTDIVIDYSHTDFLTSGLQAASTIRLHQLVTVSTVVIQRELGTLSLETQEIIAHRLCILLKE